MKKKFISIILYFFLIVCSYALHSTTFAKSQDSSNVLVLYSHHYNFEWTNELQKGITHALDSEGLYLYVEYLNEHQLSDTVSFSDYYEALDAQYKNVDIPQTSDPRQLLDLIISINPIDPLIFISSKNATSTAAISSYETIIHTDYPAMRYEIISVKTLDEALLELADLKNSQLIMLGNIPKENGTMLSPESIVLGKPDNRISLKKNIAISGIVKHIQLIKEAGYHCPIAINISAKQMNRKLIEKFTFLIDHHLIEANDLSIEITESILLDFIDIKIDILNKISALGITISIDDFGTGYSSMKYLQCLPFNKLKIDKYFIDHIAIHKERALLKSMILIAQELSLESIAEGVESIDQLNVLKEMNVDTIQGWYYSKALPIDAFILYLKEHS